MAAPKDPTTPTVAESAANPTDKAPDAPDTEKDKLPKLGTVTVDLADTNADLDPRVAAAVKAIKADKQPEGVVKSVWDIHNPSVYTLTFED